MSRTNFTRIQATEPAGFAKKLWILQDAAKKGNPFRCYPIHGSIDPKIKQVGLSVRPQERLLTQDQQNRAVKCITGAQKVLDDVHADEHGLRAALKLVDPKGDERVFLGVQSIGIDEKGLTISGVPLLAGDAEAQAFLWTALPGYEERERKAPLPFSAALTKNAVRLRLALMLGVGGKMAIAERIGDYTSLDVKQELPICAPIHASEDGTLVESIGDATVRAVFERFGLDIENTDRLKLKYVGLLANPHDMSIDILCVLYGLSLEEIKAAKIARERDILRTTYFYENLFSRPFDSIAEAIVDKIEDHKRDPKLLASIVALGFQFWGNTFIDRLEKKEIIPKIPDITYDRWY